MSLDSAFPFLFRGYGFRARAFARRRRAFGRAPGIAEQPTLRRPFVRVRVHPSSHFPFLPKKEMERREAPGDCEAPWGFPCDRETGAPRTGPAGSPPAHPVVRTGLRIPSRGARASCCGVRSPRPRRCASRRSIASRMWRPAPRPLGSRHDSDPSKSTNERIIFSLYIPVKRLCTSTSQRCFVWSENNAHQVEIIDYH